MTSSNASHFHDYIKVGRALCVSSALLAASVLALPSAAAEEATSSSTPKSDAVTSLRSILQDAVNQGLLDTDGRTEEPARTVTPDVLSNPILSSGAAARPAPMDCKIAKAADITAFSSVTTFDDVTAAKASLDGASGAPSKMRAVILTYLALGLGTEALQLSELTGEDLLALLSRILEGDISTEDATKIKSYSACHDSFRVWDLAAQLSQPAAKALATVITPADYTALASFPPKLQDQIGMIFALHAARTGDMLSAKRFLLKHAPNTKYGGLPERKDEDLLFLHALILQSKNDERSTEIFAHIASGTGRFKTLALSALADASARSGQALPPEFENDLTAVNNQYGDGLEAKTAAFELVKFRLGQSQYQDAINTAKAQFGEQDVMRLESVSLIGDRLLDEFASDLNARRLYALNGYFHDPAFFDSYPDAFGLTLQAHDTAAALSLPELAQQLLPKLQSFKDESQKADVKISVKLAEAQLAYKTSQYQDAISLLKGVKGGERFDALRKDAALASGDRLLAQNVLARLPASRERDNDYLAFTLQKGLWSESKMQAQTMLAKDKLGADMSPAVSDKSGAVLPFAFSLELLDYLTTAPTDDNAIKLPETSTELDAFLLTLKSNTNVAKGFLNYDRSSP